MKEEFTTTFKMDFTIAEKFGVKAIASTFNKVMAEWKNQYKYLTDLVIVLNKKIWEMYNAGNDEYQDIYQRCWEVADGWACDHLEGDERAYFWEMTD